MCISGCKIAFNSKINVFWKFFLTTGSSFKDKYLFSLKMFQKTLILKAFGECDCPKSGVLFSDFRALWYLCLQFSYQTKVFLPFRQTVAWNQQLPLGRYISSDLPSPPVAQQRMQSRITFWQWFMTMEYYLVFEVL